MQTGWFWWSNIYWNGAESLWNIRDGIVWRRMCKRFPWSLQQGGNSNDFGLDQRLHWKDGSKNLHWSAQIEVQEVVYALQFLLATSNSLRQTVFTSACWIKEKKIGHETNKRNFLIVFLHNFISSKKNHSWHKLLFKQNFAHGKFSAIYKTDLIYFTSFK